jgi:hypothetical protein
MQSASQRIAPLVHTCSLVQSWAPGWLSARNFMVRPNLVLLASEDHAQPLCSEFMEFRLSPVQLADWLHQCFAESGPPAELLVENEIVQGAVRFRYPRTKVRVQPTPPAGRVAFRQLTKGHPEHIPYSVVSLLGDQKALKLYQAAQAFLDSAPWQRIPDDQVFCFGSGAEELGLVVAGSSGGGDRGIYLFRSPEAAAEGEELLIACFGPAHTYLVHHEDLNFIDRHGLKPRWKYPMFMTLHGPMTPAKLKDFYWLLRRIPEFIETGTPIIERRRSLHLLSTPCKRARGSDKPLWLENMLSSFPPNCAGE